MLSVALGQDAPPPVVDERSKPAALFVQAPPQTGEQLRAKLKGLTLPIDFSHAVVPLSPNGEAGGVITGPNDLTVFYTIAPTGRVQLGAGQVAFTSNALELKAGEHRWYREQYIGDELAQVAMAMDNMLVVSYPGRGINLHTQVDGLSQLADAMLVTLSIPNRIQRVSWHEAKKLIATGDVETVMQLHSGSVTVRMADGSEVQTEQPRVDDVIKLIRSLGKDDQIGIITE